MARKMFQQKCLGVLWGLRYGSTTLALRQYEGSSPPFIRSKYNTAQTTFRQKSDKTDYIYIYRLCVRPPRRVERKRLREEDQEEDRDRRLESASRPPSRGQKGLRADEEKSKLLLLCSLYFFLPGDGVKYTRGGDQSPKVKEAHQSQDRGSRRERETRRTRGPRQPQAKTKTRSPSSEKEGTKRCARPRDRKRERPTTGFVFGKTFDCFGHPSLLTEGGSFLPGASTRWDGKKSASNASKTRGIAR